MIKTALLALALLAIPPSGFANDWESKLKAELPQLGHRNWIVVADAAYPKQSAPGITTIFTGGEQLEVLKTVLKAVEGAPHVKAIIMVDSELEHVTEEDAPGVIAYRTALKELMKGAQTKVLPHEQIISKLDEGSKLFNVLLLKTTMTIPYTSVFLELDCGYWNAEKEQRLRAAIEKKK
jgi:D-ribose pyranose/furanose isomerase RbsD